MLTRSMAAQALGCSVSWVRRHESAGRLRPVRAADGRWLHHEAEVSHLARMQAGTARPLHRVVQGVTGVQPAPMHRRTAPRRMHDAAADQAAERAAWRAAWISWHADGLVEELAAAGWPEADISAAAWSAAAALDAAPDEALPDCEWGAGVARAAVPWIYAEPPPQQQPSPCPWCGAFSPPPW